MSVERYQESEVQQKIIRNEYEQLPTITRRDYADAAFVFLFAVYGSSLLTQIIRLFPEWAMFAPRLPFLLLGLCFLLTGVVLALKRRVGLPIIVALATGVLIAL